MTFLLIGISILILCFGFVLLFGAPYLPTLSPQVNAALKLSGLESGDTLLELGCGDGKILIAAAKQGIASVGYELNPIMAAVAWLRTIRYRKLVKVICADFWRAEWPETDVIFVFLLDRYMKKLDTKCMQYKHKPVKLISFAFKIPNKHVDKQEHGLYVYDYR